MANSYVEYPDSTVTNLNGTTYATPDFLNINDINVKGYNGSTWTTLTINQRDASAKTITLSAAPSSYQKIRVYRSTTADPLVDFTKGATLTESDLDSAYQQGLYVAQEVAEDAGAVGTLVNNNQTLNGTTTVDNLTATGTVTLPNDSITTANRQALPFFSCRGYTIPDVQYVAAPNKIIRPTSDNLVNVGSHMNTSTGIFTVPTTGIYAAYIDICRNADNWISVSIQINQVKRTERQIPPMGGSNPNWFYNRAEVVAQCNQGMEIAFTYNSNYLTPSASLHQPEMGIYQIA